MFCVKCVFVCLTTASCGAAADCVCFVFVLLSVDFLTNEASVFVCVVSV